MSFCRFSCLDFKSDVYCYEHYEGFIQIHVAAKKRIFTEEMPEPVCLDRDGTQAWIERHQKVTKIVEDAELVEIGLEHDGESFQCFSHQEAISKLKMLKAVGYVVPDHAIEGLKEEALESENGE